jgi:preprotein translocase subunit SecD
MDSRKATIRTAIIAVVVIIGVFLVIGSRPYPKISDFTWSGIKKNLEQNISLGLDLKGGSHLLMRVKTDDYLMGITENNSQGVTMAVRDGNFQAGEGRPLLEGGIYKVVLDVTDPNQIDAIEEEATRKVFDTTLWSVDKGDTAITWSLSIQSQNRLKEQSVDQALRIIESRINSFGVKEPTLQKYGSSTSGQILLQMPGVDDPKRVKELIGSESRLDLMKISGAFTPFPSEQAAIQSLGGTVPFNRRVYPYTERDASLPSAQPAAKQYVVVEYPPIIEGSEIRDANAVSRTGMEGDYQISFNLKPAGAQKFGEWTARNIGTNLAIVLNGEVKSAPVIRSQITDSGQIEGRFTRQTAEDLALTLKSGALPAKLIYEEERTVGPSLGADSIKAGVQASIGGLVFVIIFMLIYYRGSGINAVIALILNMILTMAAVVMLDATLTLPGIAGLILGIGMAVDSNVLIFERMREELRSGAEAQKSIDVGFAKAFITIVDTHVTTIIAAVILYMYGSGPIRGFAVTLILGLLINLFTAVYVSRTIFMWILVRNPSMKKLSI